MDPDPCSDVIFWLFAMFVCSVAPENDNITLISRRLRRFWVKLALFLVIFAVFDLSRPLEGRYGPGLVLRRDILVVYGVCVCVCVCVCVLWSLKMIISR